jgi:tetratricopeptide (TPR) repeat protein
VTSRAARATPAGVPATAPTDVAIPVVVPRRSRRGLQIAIGGGLIAIAAAVTVMTLGDAAAKRRDQALVIQRQGVEAADAGNRAAARALFERALKLDPKQAGALTSLGLIAEDEQRYATAESLFSAVLRHSPDDPGVQSSAYYNRGNCRLSTRQFPGAVEDLRAAMALDSSGAETYNNLGLALIQNGQPADARPVLERGIARFPSVKYLYKNAALAAIQLGDPARALTFIDRALRVDPKYAEAESLRAQAMALTSPRAP